jgi:hypothetical protein
LYNDLVLAYNNGAKYAVVFDYPKLDTAKYGILMQDHLEAIKKRLELRGKQCSVKRRLQKRKNCIRTARRLWFWVPKPTGQRLGIVGQRHTNTANLQRR